MSGESPSKRDCMETLTSEHFCFECRPDIECFNACCANLDLQLSPLDILKLARRLDITTTAFLEKHTIAIEISGRLPRVALTMNEEDGRCPFVTDKGCSVYEARPGACRTYPLGRAASPSPMSGQVKEAFFRVREEHCKGHDEPREWTISEWMSNQGMEEINRMNDLWMEILAKQASVVQGPGCEQKVRMFNLASYDLDTFRTFVMEGGLLNRLELPERFVEKLKTDDIQLLRFAFSWLRLSLFGEMNSGLMGR